MIPNKNRTENDQTDQGSSEQISNPQPTSYRPNWIIPDKEHASTNKNHSDHRQNNQQDNSPHIPMDNDETLGIP